jgi:hypothetical protein
MPHTQIQTVTALSPILTIRPENGKKGKNEREVKSPPVYRYHSKVGKLNLSLLLCNLS